MNGNCLEIAKYEILQLVEPYILPFNLIKLPRFLFTFLLNSDFWADQQHSSVLTGAGEEKFQAKGHQPPVFNGHQPIGLSVWRRSILLQKRFHLITNLLSIHKVLREGNMLRIGIM